MKNLKSVVAVLAISLLLASNVFADGIIQTPGRPAPAPTPIVKSDFAVDVVLHVLRALSLLK